LFAEASHGAPNTNIAVIRTAILTIVLILVIAALRKSIRILPQQKNFEKVIADWNQSEGCFVGVFAETNSEAA